MKRHYFKAKLVNPSHRLASLADDEYLLWQLPPYLIARFGGEISQVMLEAAQKYIYLRCLEHQRQSFKATAFSHHSEQA